MTAAEIAFAAFGLCNSLRVIAYVSQIFAIAPDTHGGSGVSYTAWGLFALSNMSTVAYALLTVQDWRMAAVFGVNAACCGAILLLTALRRWTFVANR